MARQRIILMEMGMEMEMRGLTVEGVSVARQAGRRVQRIYSGKMTERRIPLHSTQPTSRENFVKLSHHIESVWGVYSRRRG